MDLELSNRTIVITASNSGLGKACAKRYLLENANVVMASNSEESIQRTASELIEDTKISEDRLMAVKCDVTSVNDIRSLISQTIDEFGSLDVLLCNHGEIPAVSFEQSSINEWDVSHKNVVSSNRWLAEVSLPHLQRSEIGSLIIITNSASREPKENDIISNVFRLSLYGLAKTISKEYSPEVRANIISFHAIKSDEFQQRIKEKAKSQEITSNHALQSHIEEVSLDRPGDPSELADAVSYLSSPRASYITGEVISVDGGWSQYVL